MHSDHMRIVYVIGPADGTLTPIPLNARDEADSLNSLTQRLLRIGLHEAVRMRIKLRHLTRLRRHHCKPVPIAGDKMRSRKRRADSKNDRSDSIPNKLHRQPRYDAR